MNSAVAEHDGHEVQTGAELLELHADLAQAGGHGHGLLAADQEAGGPAAQRHQARFGQQFGQAIVAQRFQEILEAPGVVDEAQKQVGGPSGRGGQTCTG